MSELPSGERDVLMMIAAKLLSATAQAHRFEAVTAEWESMLKQAEQGELAADTSMDGIADMSRTLVKEHTAPEERFAGLFPDARKNKREAVGACPRCGGTVYEGKKGFFCDSQDCSFAL